MWNWCAHRPHWRGNWWQDPRAREIVLEKPPKVKKLAQQAALLQLWSATVRKKFAPIGDEATTCGASVGLSTMALNMIVVDFEVNGHYSPACERALSEVLGVVLNLDQKNKGSDVSLRKGTEGKPADLFGRSVESL